MQELKLTCPFTGVEFTAIETVDGDLLVIHPLTKEQIKINFNHTTLTYSMNSETFKHHDTVTPAELIGILGVSRQRVSQIVQDEVIPVHLVNGSPVFLLSDVLEYKENRKVGAPYGNANASKR